MDEKKVYQQKLQAQLDAWKAKIDELKARAEEADSEARLIYLEEVKALDDTREEAEQKLGELCLASESAWDDLKHGVDSAWHKLGKAVESALSRFK